VWGRVWGLALCVYWVCGVVCMGCGNVCVCVEGGVEFRALYIQLKQTLKYRSLGCTETIQGPPLIILTPQIRLHLNYSFKGLAAITRNCKQTDVHKLYFTTMQLSQYRFLVAMSTLQELQEQEGDINTTLTFQRPETRGYFK
jgi:hypothetical protein